MIVRLTNRENRRLPSLPSLPSMLSLTSAVITGAATLGLFLSSFLLAQPPATSPEIKPGEIKKSQEENKKRYSRLSTDILKLALRWEKSDNPEDQSRAKTLRAVLKLADEKGVETLFKQMIEGIDNKNPNRGDLQRLIGNDDKLIAALEEILKTLDSEDEASVLRREIEDLKALIKQVEQLKREEERIRARTDNPRSDADKIAKDQNNLAKQTEDLANKLAGKDPKKANGADAKDDKAQPKPEGKPGEGDSEAKPDTKENKVASKAGDDGKQGDPKAGDPKSGDPKGGDPKGGDPKGGDPKSGDPKGGDPKGGDPKGGDPKGGDPKSGEPKSKPMGGMDPGDSKDAPKEGPMAGDAKSGDSKPMGGSPMDPRGGDQKPMPGESKAQGDGKGDMKPSHPQGGAEGKPMSGAQSPPSAGQPSASKPSGGQPSGGQPSDSPPSGSQRPTDQAQENIEQAVPQQKGAEQDLKKNERSDASKKEDIAIEKLQKAIEQLEKLLKQLREKELAKLLGNLEERVNRMLRMQEEVYQNTKTLDKIVKKNGGKKSNSELQKSQIEGEKEGVIVAEADKALKLMEGEGSAVVFAGVLSQVKEDMIAVQKRLLDGRVEGRDKADQAEGTQLIEEDIIDQLKMMKEALKKAKQDLENKQNDPPPPDGGGGGGGNKELLDMINELKLIKSLQEQVNKRTTSYSKQDPGEQAKDPLIQGELKQLSDRQRVLQDMLHKIATKANQ